MVPKLWKFCQRSRAGGLARCCAARRERPKPVLRGTSAELEAGADVAEAAAGAAQAEAAMPRFWRRRSALALAGLLLLLVVCVLLVYTTVYSPELDWLRRSRDAALYVRPGEQTALLLPRSELCHVSGTWQQGPVLLMAVPSAIGRRQRRDAVRQTWGRREPSATRLLFVVGHRGQGVPPEIAEEAALHGDILVEDFLDTYHNLTLKTLFILKWAVSHCPKATYLLKVDDDVLVNVHGVLRLLSEAASRGWGLVGNVFHGRPHRWRLPYPQWYLPRWLHPEPALPDYLTGPSYAVAGWALAPLLRAALRTPLLPLEDVFVTGVAARAAGLAQYHVPTIAVDRPLLAERLLCHVRSYLTMHKVGPERMLYFWRQMTSPQQGTFWHRYGLDACQAEYGW
ncbi:beta-1,3-galactosyltransferase 1-like [Schistocerca nitens]|uniref:beta-1,3-galactosyltransferase 1-like n=1 Tax=Schistocerca nitens TaxID=7011 RepID=UPI002117F2E7|nr:beta-1,3-galactosyltransferase 1-like [Schistocerca nitens]